MTMKHQGEWSVLHLGNTNNIGYLNARFQRRAGFNADLLFDPTDHVSYHPNWGEPDGKDSWVRYYRNRARHGFRLGRWQVWFPYFHRLQQCADVMRLGWKYDILQAYNYDAILCLPQIGKPVVAFCVGGDLNVTALGGTWVGALLRMTYRRASAVLYSNIDMLPAVNQLGLRNARYIPLPVDTERLLPVPEECVLRTRRELNVDVQFVCFSPTRHDWAVKGNDKLIMAWEKVVDWAITRSIKVKLVLCEWGEDVLRSKRLVVERGLAHHVRWESLMDKQALRSWYWVGNVVADQFNLKAFGLIALEGMACGKPVIASCDRRVASEFYREPPPICECSEIKDIAEHLKALAGNPRLGAELGIKSRRWVETYHSPEIIVREHIALYADISSGRTAGRKRIDT